MLVLFCINFQISALHEVPAGFRVPTLLSTSVHICWRLCWNPRCWAAREDRCSVCQRPLGFPWGFGSYGTGWSTLCCPYCPAAPAWRGCPAGVLHPDSWRCFPSAGRWATTRQRRHTCWFFKVIHYNAELVWKLLFMESTALHYFWATLLSGWSLISFFISSLTVFINFTFTVF